MVNYSVMALEQMAQTAQYILETRSITKQFPKVLANDDVSITLRKGEILSLLGENGAGKKHAYEHAVWFVQTD